MNYRFFVLAVPLLFVGCAMQKISPDPGLAQKGSAYTKPGQINEVYLLPVLEYGWVADTVDEKTNQWIAGHTVGTELEPGRWAPTEEAETLGRPYLNADGTAVYPDGAVQQQEKPEAGMEVDVTSLTKRLKEVEQKLANLKPAPAPLKDLKESGKIPSSSDPGNPRDGLPVYDGFDVIRLPILKKGERTVVKTPSGQNLLVEFQGDQASMTIGDQKTEKAYTSKDETLVLKFRKLAVRP